MAGVRLEVDRAVVVAGEAAGDVKAEAGSLSQGLGCEKRIEDAVADLGRNPVSVIADSHDHALVLAVRKHIDSAAARHGVQGVVDQVSP